MRISDWSSDVCSSDLTVSHPGTVVQRFPENPAGRGEKTSACCSDGALPYLMSRQRMNRPGACRQRPCTGKGDACLGRLPARAARSVHCPSGTSRQDETASPALTRPPGPTALKKHVSSPPHTGWPANFFLGLGDHERQPLTKD